VGVPKALPQSHHFVSCPAPSSCTGGTPTLWVFSFLCVFSVICRVKGFTVAGVQILPPTSEKKYSHPTAGGCPQTQLGTRNGWPLAHKEHLCPLTEKRNMGAVASTATSPIREPDGSCGDEQVLWCGCLRSACRRCGVSGCM